MNLYLNLEFCDVVRLVVRDFESMRWTNLEVDETI